MAENEEPQAEPREEFVEYPRNTGPRPFDLSAINDAFRIWTSNFVPYLVVGGAMVLVVGVLWVVMSIIMLPGFLAGALGGEGRNPMGIFMISGASLFFSLVSSVVSSVVAAPFLASLTYMGLKDVEGERRASIDDLSYGFKNHITETLIFGAMIGVISAVAGLLSCLGLVLQIAAFAFLLLTLPLIIDRKLTAFDAARTSMNLVSRQFWMVLLYSFIGGLIAGIGVVACVVGVLATAGFTGVVYAVGYWRLTEEDPIRIANPAPYDPAPPAPTPVTPEEVVSGPEDQGDTLADPGADVPPTPEDGIDTSGDETRN